LTLGTALFEEDVSVFVAVLQLDRRMTHATAIIIEHNEPALHCQHRLILEPISVMPDFSVRIPFDSFSVGHASFPLALVGNKNIMLALI
jgi:hypothetical protein